MGLHPRRKLPQCLCAPICHPSPHPQQNAQHVAANPWRGGIEFGDGICYPSDIYQPHSQKPGNCNRKKKKKKFNILHFFLKVTLWGSDLHYLYFTNKETETQKLSNLPRSHTQTVTHPVRFRPRIWIPVMDLEDQQSLEALNLLCTLKH